MQKSLSDTSLSAAALCGIEERQMVGSWMVVLALQTGRGGTREAHQGKRQGYEFIPTKISFNPSRELKLLEQLDLGGISQPKLENSNLCRSCETN